MSCAFHSPAEAMGRRSAPGFDRSRYLRDHNTCEAGAWVCSGSRERIRCICCVWHLTPCLCDISGVLIRADRQHEAYFVNGTACQLGEGECRSQQTAGAPGPPVVSWRGQTLQARRRIRPPQPALWSTVDILSIRYTQQLNPPRSRCSFCEMRQDMVNDQ